MNKFASKAARKLKRNIPVILSVLSVVGLAATTVLAIKATPKAMELIKDEKTAKGDDLTTLETIKAAWKPYVPTAIVFELLLVLSGLQSLTKDSRRQWQVHTLLCLLHTTSTRTRLKSCMAKRRIGKSYPQ